MLIRFRSFIEWEFLNHAVDVVDFGELDGFLAVYGRSALDIRLMIDPLLTKCLTARPAMDGQAFPDHGYRVDFDLADRWRGNIVSMHPERKDLR